MIYPCGSKSDSASGETSGVCLGVVIHIHMMYTVPWECNLSGFYNSVSDQLFDEMYTMLTNHSAGGYMGNRCRVQNNVASSLSLT